MPPYSAVPTEHIQTIRTELGTQVRCTSLRQTARAVGLSPMGLLGFINGREPHTATRKKVIEWYVRTERKRRARVSPATAHAALGLLTYHLPEPLASATRQLILQQLADVTTEAALPLPAWVV